MLEEVLPEGLLDLPEVGRLPREGGAVDPRKGGEPLRVVALEVGVDAPVGVYPQGVSSSMERGNPRPGLEGHSGGPVLVGYLAESR